MPGASKLKKKKKNHFWDSNVKYSWRGTKGTEHQNMNGNRIVFYDLNFW